MSEQTEIFDEASYLIKYLLPMEGLTPKQQFEKNRVRLNLSPDYCGPSLYHGMTKKCNQCDNIIAYRHGWYESCLSCIKSHVAKENKCSTKGCGIPCYTNIKCRLCMGLGLGSCLIKLKKK